ncbi:16S rRNA (uracil(1498)-N(3))-methyltransferase [Thiovibrio frasassiensis]|uniref:Ribosomal RNA small subunit methyltransferase E n=1 Tax=Thiovibrio frasassiensis TaxID=2984131 RepID=A0A9X4MBR0_9BACT|nr:16S rRNA (uracil(1498)-N(3))-methyltransferase [Thiovibrio frasassiensis]MDG4474541.1 16S rRNA (uracil(1498)-N(3))-methyltransferase [Thiovibrio frasassiensis]
MSLRRFFINPADITGETAQLTGPEAHHLRNVLRLSPGDPITFFDGTGARYQALIKQLHKDRVTATIIAQSHDLPPKVRLHLGQALLKGQKMELILQKTTEMGVDTVWPFYSEHGSHKPQRETQAERWQRIVLEACKQCNRAKPPELHEPRELPDLISHPPPCDIRLIFWEDESKHTLHEALATPKNNYRSVFFLLGPEGGFSEAEVACARQEGFTPVSLGPRILRAETATLAATAILQFTLGNLDPVPSGNLE